MSFSLRPDYYTESILKVSPNTLKENGITNLLLDLDNTISPYYEKAPQNDLIEWAKNMKEGGITLYIVSNSKKKRPEIFAKGMGIPFIKHARKPSSKNILKAMEEIGGNKKNTALAGDQIFTDIYGANRAGINSILVYPIKFSRFFYLIRYYIETPFRNSYKNKL